MQDNDWMNNFRVCFDLHMDESWAKFIHKPQNFHEMQFQLETFTNSDQTSKSYLFRNNFDLIFMGVSGQSPLLIHHYHAQRWTIIFFNPVVCKCRKVALASHLQWNTGNLYLLKDTWTHHLRDSYLDNLMITWGFYSPLFILLHIVEICKYA